MDTVLRLAALCLLGALLAVLLRRGGGELALLLVLAVSASVVIMACSSRPLRTSSKFSTATRIPMAAILKIRSTSIVCPSQK